MLFKGNGFYASEARPNLCTGRMRLDYESIIASHIGHVELKTNYARLGCLCKAIVKQLVSNAKRSPLYLKGETVL